MGLDKIFSVVIIALCLVVLGFGMVLIRHYQQKQEPVQIVDTNWETIESRVESDIGIVGYQFLVSSIDSRNPIPAIDRTLYDTCLQVYAELRIADKGLTLEYLAKYNQIVRIRMLRAGIDCQA